MKKLIPIAIIAITLLLLLIIPRLQNKPDIKPLEEPKLIQVEIAGEIHMPGVYEVISGTTLDQLIEYALGTTMYADLSSINGSTLLIANVKYIIQSKSSINEKAKININQADLESLMGLPGIGKVTAQKIIDYRVKEGPFMRIEDIQMVSGIGVQTFEQIKTFITI